MNQLEFNISREVYLVISLREMILKRVYMSS